MDAGGGCPAVQGDDLIPGDPYLVAPSGNARTRDLQDIAIDDYSGRGQGSTLHDDTGLGAAQDQAVSKRNCP